MSLSDLTSSVKNLGLLGLLLGMIVFVSLVVLITTNVDDQQSSDDDQSIGLRIRSSAAEIKQLQEKLVSAHASLDQLAQREEFMEEIKLAKAVNAGSEAILGMLREELQALDGEHEAYKQQYRDQVRGQAAGTRMELLATPDGKVYHDVKVLKVGALGMNIMHRNGTCRISYRDLPAKLQEHYQFSEDEAERARAKEVEKRRRHNLAHAKVQSARDLKAKRRIAEDERAAGIKRQQVIVSNRRTLGASKLESTRLEPASLRSARLDSARLEPSRPRRLQSSVRLLSARLARNALTPANVRGAVSAIPPSKLGELFYGVACELERQEGKVTHTAVGYFIAALTDPAGQSYGDAKRRLREVLLEDELPHEQAVELYNGGLATFRALCASNVGIAESGVSRGLSDLREIKLAYHAKRTQ